MFCNEKRLGARAAWLSRIEKRCDWSARACTGHLDRMKTEIGIGIRMAIGIGIKIGIGMEMEQRNLDWNENDLY